ncbi:hypothetical protein [Fluviispira sanaruensis]|uniref:Uncharacterized protein n=1 Tax=Fluviispira sanaruensis TaxID=2493639 RepID=A0A4P2VPI4_FLUSA|nr:hypothetical protein [Fluviispira sanaruensis]BBH54110.1 hypothetical protein JCM31447_25670 [Fluviispira sanaruensis]
MNKVWIISAIIILSVLKTSNLYADENIILSDSWGMSFGFRGRGALRSAGKSFSLRNSPDQSSENQAASAAAYSIDSLSVKFSLELRDWVSLKTRVDYYWNSSFIYNLYPKDYEQNKFHLRDFYLSFPSNTKMSSFWIGRRTFEFENIYLFQLDNPFNQIELQGFGYENEVFQASIALNNESLFTTGRDINGNQVLDSDNNPQLFQEHDLIITAFFSGKFLLSEGKIFQPVFALRYYQELTKQENDSNNVKLDTVVNSSSFMVGGIFSRPLADGLKGHTTVWFQSLPTDKNVRPYNNAVSSSYMGKGRVPPNYPQNTIGILDSSEFYFTPYAGVLSGIILLNNTYASELPVLKIADDKKSLEHDGTQTSRLANRLSVDIQPVYFITRNWQLGLDLSLVYVSRKLIASDANSVVITPILKYSFDKKLRTNQYFFFSCSFGYYDWKIKAYPDGTKTQNLFTTQSGINFLL